MVLGGQDKWRKHPLLFEQWRRPLPGFGTAVVIFAGYLLVENIFKRLTDGKLILQ